MKQRLYILSPFESRMAKRGTRHPKLAEFLCKQGHEVEYVTTNFSHARKEYFEKKEILFFKEQVEYELTVLNVHGYEKNISISRVFTHLQLSVKIFRFLARKARVGDIVVLPSRPPELIFAVSLLKRYRSVRVVLDIRDVWPDSLETKRPLVDFGFRIYCNAFLYPSLKSVDRYIHVAPSFLDWLKRYVPGVTSSFVPLGFDAERWATMKGESRFENIDRSNVVYVGSLSHQIDLTCLINALANDKRYELTVIGDGEDMRKVQELAVSLQMKNIRFTGYIPFENVVEELGGMHLGVIPMTGYAMPNKLFDYIAASLPILVLGRNDASEFVESHNIGWSADFDVEGLRTFFLNLTAGEIASKAKNVGKIRDGFSKEHLYKRYLQVISDLSIDKDRGEQELRRK